MNEQNWGFFMGAKEVAGTLPNEKTWGFVKATLHKTSTSPDATVNEKP